MFSFKLWKGKLFLRCCCCCFYLLLNNAMAELDLLFSLYSVLFFRSVPSPSYVCCAIVFFVAFSRWSTPFNFGLTLLVFRLVLFFLTMIIIKLQTKFKCACKRKGLKSKSNAVRSTSMDVRSGWQWDCSFHLIHAAHINIMLHFWSSQNLLVFFFLDFNLSLIEPVALFVSWSNRRCVHIIIKNPQTFGFFSISSLLLLLSFPFCCRFWL